MVLMPWILEHFKQGEKADDKIYVCKILILEAVNYEFKD